MNTKQIKQKVDKLLSCNCRVDLIENDTMENYYETLDNIFSRDDFWEVVSFPDEVLAKEIEDIKGQYSDDDMPSKDTIEDEARRSAEENLAYWTVYFKPRIENSEIAIKCGLTPFYYDDELYLALGGCGMDLSPKLDTYQALTHNTIPKGSMFFDDSTYFEYVAGKENTKEVVKAIKLEYTVINISYAL